MKITVKNNRYNTRTDIVIKKDGRLSDLQINRAWRTLSGIPGDGSGPLGETHPFHHPWLSEIKLAVYKDSEGLFIGEWHPELEIPDDVELMTPTENL